MKSSKNRVELIGHLGADPEEKKTNGQAMVKFRMATNESYRNKEGNWEENTQWHNIVAFGKVAEETLERLKKGDEVLIRGKLRHSSYKDKEGIMRYSTDIFADSLDKIAKRDKVALVK